MAHSRDLVSRVKGALSVLAPKQIAYLTGIPVATIKQWGAGTSRGDVEADTEVAKDVRDVLFKRFVGRAE